MTEFALHRHVNGATGEEYKHRHPVDFDSPKHRHAADRTKVEMHRHAASFQSESWNNEPKPVHSHLYNREMLHADHIRPPDNDYGLTEIGWWVDSGEDD